MKLANLNDWLTLVANVGVLAGLIFVGLEIRQNTLALEREIRISNADAVHGQVANSDYLVQINQKMAAMSGGPNALVDLVDAYQEVFGLSENEAHRWWRYLMQVWQRNQADWIYSGREDDDCGQAEALLRFKDNQLFFDAMKGELDQEYVACVHAVTGPVRNDG